MKKIFLLSLITTASLLAACAVAGPKYHYTAPTPALRLTLLPHDTLSAGKSTEIEAKLTNIKTLGLLRDNDLDVVHMQKIHLLIIDPTLTDYQHIHPTITAIPGLYHFQFTPKLPGNYRVWADVTPTATHKQEYVLASLGNTKPGKINKTESHEANVGGYHFNLTFDTPPVEGAESIGTVHITDAKGNNVEALQPLMGAYGHIVGFYDDFHTVVHTHSLGAEPAKDTDRTGPDLTFHLMAVQPGFIKLFAQVKINNKELFAPFGVNVKAADAK